MILVGVFLGVCRDRRIALVVSGRRTGGRGIISWEDGSSGFFPLRLFCVDVDVEPVMRMLATLRARRYSKVLTIPCIGRSIARPIRQEPRGP
jgi:hypothetical protein